MPLSALSDVPSLIWGQGRYKQRAVGSRNDREQVGSWVCLCSTGKGERACLWIHWEGGEALPAVRRVESDPLPATQLEQGAICNVNVQGLSVATRPPPHVHNVAILLVESQASSFREPVEPQLQL